MKAHFKAFFCSYAEIFFLPIGVLGAAVFALTMVEPAMGLAGMLSVLAAYVFARLIGMGRQVLESGFYTYNPLLVGLSIGYLFEFSSAMAFLAAAVGVATFLLTVFLADVLMTRMRLPILSLPFVIVSSIAYLGSLRYANLHAGTHIMTGLLASDLGMPFWLAGFFRAFGAVLFLPSVVVGLAIGFSVLCYSRILFLLAVIGHFTGAMVRTWMLGSAPDALADPGNFNFIFIAMAIGGVFLVPSPVSYLLAMAGVVLATLFMDAVSSFWATYGIPVFTLPFNIVTIGMVHVLGLLRHPMIPATIGRTPEETLGNFLANRLRYRGGDRTLYLPFSGRWTVWQGFDGAWTHKGSWRYAYDFVITDELGKTHGGDGTRLEDYHCYGKPVLSPVRGRVVQVVDDLPDSAVGSADEVNNWGNAVVIEDPRGFHVELSHFAAKSVRVKKGDWVERGAVLGLCGNSGYSPQPHIHVQAQVADTIGAASLPFSFVSYAGADAYQANDVPDEKSVVEPLYRDKRLDQCMNFVLDDTLRFRVTRRGRSAGTLEMKVEMAVDGTFCFATSRGCLYFGRHEGTFYLYRVTGDDPWLRLIHLALPRMPLAYRDNLSWRDYLPAGLVAPGLRGALVGFLGSIFPGLATASVAQRFVAADTVESVIECAALRVRRTARVELDRRKGFVRIAVDDVLFERIDADAKVEEPSAG